ncbi:MAG: indole-3-glycerol phosphate synthase TrpC [Gemmatimonadales bacterium]
MPLLDEIVEATRASIPFVRARRGELERRAAERPIPPDFRLALQGQRVAVVAEVKRRSPSAGAINPELVPAMLATGYADGGAAAVSVLTDSRFFGGSMADLEAVAAAVARPVLRKDFILDESQILEARAGGAAAVLLIVRILSDDSLVRLIRCAAAAGVHTLVETHTAVEIDRAAGAGAGIIGVNARDLDTLAVNTAAAWNLLRLVPPGCVAVAESGMATRTDVERAASAGADAVLIGSAAASAADPVARIRELSGVARRDR